MLKEKYPLFLANKPQQPNQSLEVRDKFTGEIATRVALADAVMIDRAIAAATHAAEPMRRLAAYERQAILNHCVAATRSVQQLLQDIADRLDDGQAVPEQLYLTCKVMAAELMWEVVDRCVQMLGARGFVDTNVVGQYFRDFRLIRIFEGPTELLLVYLGLDAAKHGSSYVEKLTALYGASPAVQLLRGMFEELQPLS